MKRYGLNDYYADRLGLVREEISSIFSEEAEAIEEPEEKQISLTDFMRR